MIETIFEPTAGLQIAGRVLAGAAVAATVAGAAWQSGALSRSGFAAAVACGTVCVIAGWNWALLLVLYFVAAALLSVTGRRQKEAMTYRVVQKSGARDAAQVLANGGLYSAVVLLGAQRGLSAVVWGAVGALAASSADSWATEIGVWLGRRPRSIISWTYVRPGQSGGVTVAGLAASVAGAAWVGAAAMATGEPAALGLAALVAGFGGSLTDSILGATVQEQLRCEVCNEPTERAVHVCGTTTRLAGGIRGFNNDVINLLATFAGFLLGLMCYWITVNMERGRNPIG
jgi:uncharacterized protein (TIGR00297 family)